MMATKKLFTIFKNRPTFTWVDSLFLGNPHRSLAVFRIIFGLLIVATEIRFINRGWITEFYVKPQFYFTFYGFDWIHPLPEPYIYWIFYALIFLGILITIGLFYRFAIILFFLIFTYIELLDKSVYLNHYYQVSLLAFLMCFLPMNRALSLDKNLLFKRKKDLGNIDWANFGLWALRFQVGSVYFFGGIAKLKYDWLFKAQPLRIWLSANEHLPVVGHLLTEKWVAFLISWLAMIFDLSAPFLLCNRKTRFPIYIIIVAFHLLTHLLFNIGMFPWMMIFTALIFFLPVSSIKIPNFNFYRQKSSFWILGGFFLIQIIMPFRSHFYDGNVLWHEQGFRFSWNIMLMEKNGVVEYQVKIKKTGEVFTVKPADFLTPVQTRQMSFQPDMMLQFAHYLHQYYLDNGVGDTEIRAECYASLNGRGSQLLIDPNVDLVKESEGFRQKNWVTELK